MTASIRSIPKIRDYRDSHYDPFTALKVLGGEGRIGDIYPELRRLRLQSPVFEGNIKQHFGIEGDITMAKLRHVAILGYSIVNRVKCLRRGIKKSYPESSMN